ncbi:MAG: hypothetical protein QF554_04020 [Dehalococcoidia bacterium]|jgi:hypothetical protein|nr:hypothetical protein [Dehalococcoidia bacterium]
MPNPMQKIATKLFITASILFGISGIGFWITIPRHNDPQDDLNYVFGVLAGVTVSVVLSSFAVSVAGKYLKDD